jgi:hypothetical protein
VSLGGPQQVGQTSLGRAVVADPHARLNYDVAADRDAILSGRLPPTDVWFFDEIQRFRGWRNFLKGLYNAPPRSKRHDLSVARPRLTPVGPPCPLRAPFLFNAVFGLSAIAVALIKLGAMAGWDTFLSAAVEALALQAIVLVALVVWRVAFRSPATPGPDTAVAALRAAGLPSWVARGNLPAVRMPIAAASRLKYARRPTGSLARRTAYCPQLAHSAPHSHPAATR